MSEHNKECRQNNCNDRRKDHMDIGHQFCICTCATPQTDHIGKGNEMVQEKQDWGERFDIEFPMDDFVGHDYRGLELNRQSIKDFIRTEIAKAREEGRREGEADGRGAMAVEMVATCRNHTNVARAEVLQKIEDWATTYMDETTRIYGTDKHGIDYDDLLTFINSLKYENRRISEKERVGRFRYKWSK